VPVLVVGSEKSFKDLRRRLFADASVSSAAAKRVRDALVEANPHVDLARLRPGTVLTIPDRPEIHAVEDLSLGGVVQTSLDDAARALDELVAEAASAASGADREERAGIEDALRALDDDTVGRQASADPDAERALEQAVSGLKRAADAFEERKALRAASVEAWRAELSELRALVR
jgi:hypothetical protein